MKNHTDIYVTSITEDLRERFVRDETLIFDERKIERIYEFEDGAVVKYEWRDASAANSFDENFNHRFTLEKLPSPNPHKLEKGVIRTIEYTNSG